MNDKKTKFTVTCKDNKEICQLLIKNIPVERVSKFAYLETRNKE